MQIPTSTEIILAGEVIGAILTIIGFALGAKKYVIAPVINHVKLISEKFDKLDDIWNEIRTNGGGSIKDSINVITRGMARIEKRQWALLSYENRGFWESDEKGECIWVNRAYLRFLGATHEEVLGQGWHNFIYEKDKERVFAAWDNAIKSGIDFKEFYRFRSTDNKVKCAMIEAFVQKSPKGDVTGYIGCVTEQGSEVCE